MSSQNISMLHPRDTELEALAQCLEATGNYKILRRLIPRDCTAVSASGERHGIIIDLETTGLDPIRDEVIELGAVKFSYADGDIVTGVSAVFQSFNQPSIAIPAEVTRLTGITDAMVAGHTIDGSALEAFIGDASVIIAHNAGFDRKFAERVSPVFAQMNWACSATEIDWKAHGFSGARLAYLLGECGLFHDAHRAIDDCHALLEVLARPLPAISSTALAALLDRARRKSVRVWAENSPFDLKDLLKKRGYRWSDGANGTPRSWYIDVDEDRHAAELDYLRSEIYQREIDIRSQVHTARERFSVRA